MNNKQIRENRLQELSRLVVRLSKKGIGAEKIIKELNVRARQMASETTARDYVEEVIRRFSK